MEQLRKKLLANVLIAYQSPGDIHSTQSNAEGQAAVAGLNLADVAWGNFKPTRKLLVGPALAAGELKKFINQIHRRSIAY